MGSGGLNLGLPSALLPMEPMSTWSSLQIHQLVSHGRDMFVNDRRSEKQTALGSGIDILNIYTLHITVSSIFRVRYSYCTRKFSFKCSEGSLHENEKGVFQTFGKTPELCWGMDDQPGGAWRCCVSPQCELLCILSR